MKHEFTNNDLGRALDQVTYDAGKIQGVPYITLRQFLDALPDVPHCGDCAVDRAKAGVYEQLLDHPYFDGWSEADESVVDYMIGRLNEAHKNEQTYPQMELDDVRKGDRVIIHTTRGSAYEVTVIKRDEYAITWEKSSVSNRYIDRIYLMDRPVTHPDPAVHRYIVDHDDHDMLYQSYVSVQSNKADDLYYSPENYLGVAPEQFTNWSEAVVKVVADDE